MQPIETAVMGRIVAGLTHEMNNVLTIVQENAGLTEDLLDAGKNYQHITGIPFSMIPY